MGCRKTFLVFGRTQKYFALHFNYPIEGSILCMCIKISKILMRESTDNYIPYVSESCQFPGLLVASRSADLNDSKNNKEL